MDKKVSLQRMTRQRRLLMQVLDRKNWHPTAEEIYDIVRERAPRISLGTVYRNLDILSREGIVQKVDAAGLQRRFDGNPKPHSHAQCLECLEVWDVETAPESFFEPVLVMCPDFRITGYKLVYEGYCSKCRPHSDLKQE
jgi:Fur family transcriptional regulator, ferric uptake regulator